MGKGQAESSSSASVTSRDKADILRAWSGGERASSVPAMRKAGEEVAVTDREIIETLATKVLGLTIVRVADFRTAGGQLFTGRFNGEAYARAIQDWQSVLIDQDGDYYRLSGPRRANLRFDPTTSISDAWMLVDVLRGRLPQQDIHIEHLEGSGWSISTCYGRSSGGWDGWVTDESICRAICLAALRALAIEPAVAPDALESTGPMETPTEATAAPQEAK